jgi:hypothetical protein
MYILVCKKKKKKKIVSERGLLVELAPGPD